MAMAFRGFGAGDYSAIDPTASNLVPVNAPAADPVKRKFGIADGIGLLGDALQSFGGGRGTYAPLVMAQQQRQQDLADAAAQRQAQVQDWIFKQQYQAANPGPSKTEQDIATWQRLTPEQKAAYQEMHPEYRQGPDGQFYRINIAGNMPAQTGALPTFSQDDWDKAGGSAGNGTGGFR